MDAIEMGLEDSIKDERLRPFLPLIYIAWSDGELSSQEMRDICELVSGLPGIDGDCQGWLGRWLDTANPPEPDILEQLRLQVATWLAELDVSPTTTASDIGVALAINTRSDHKITNQERLALDRIDDEIGTLLPGSGIVAHPVQLAPIERRAPEFDVESMKQILDGDFGRTRDDMRGILSRPEFEYVDDLAPSPYREKVMKWTESLAAEGLGSLAYPKPHGAGDMGRFISVFRMLGHHDLSLLTKFGVQFGLFGGAIARLGTQTHWELYLKDIGSLDLPGCFAMTETAHGSNIRDLETTATYDPTSDELVINTPRDLARKEFIGNAARHGRMAVTFVRLIVGVADHGVHAVVVPIRNRDGSTADGVTIVDNWGKGGLNGVDNGAISFHDVRVPRTSLLNRYANIDASGKYRSEIPNRDRRFFTTIGTLVGGRISVGAAANSVAESAVTIALRYAHRRRQFGENPNGEELLIDYPLHQLRLVPRLAATYAFHFAFDQLIADYTGGEGDQREIEARAAVLKALGSWHALDTIQTAREACGGQGYLSINRLTQMYADADVFTTFEGDNTVLLQLVAKGLLTDFAQQFESMNTVGMLRYLMKRAQATLAEAGVISLSTTDEVRLADPIWQHELLGRRKDHHVGSLARQLKKDTDAGVSPVEAFNRVQSQSSAAARSHGELVLLQSFINRVEGLSSGAERDTLDKLRALHGLTTIRADLSWFQQRNILSASTASAVIQFEERLVTELVDDSLGLVDAFAIPEKVLSAPIATYQTEKEIE